MILYTMSTGSGRTHRRVRSHTLQWRHNGRVDDSNHQPHDCFRNRLFRRRSRERSKLRVTGLCAGNSPVNSPHKGPVTRECFHLMTSLWIDTTYLALNSELLTKDTTYLAFTGELWGVLVPILEKPDRVMKHCKSNIIFLVPASRNLLRNHQTTTMAFPWNVLLTLYTQLTVSMATTHNFQKKELSAIPVDNFTDAATVIDLSKNNIDAIHGAFENCVNLTKLYLHRNSISTVHADDFRGLVSLQILTLGFNRLGTIHEDALLDLTGLIEFSAQWNGLQRMPILTCEATLKKLDLSSNWIHTLFPGYFKNFSSLSYISFFSNNINSLKGTVLSGLRNLKELYMTKNMIATDLDISVFEDLGQLRILGLGENEITQFPCFVLYSKPRFTDVIIDVGNNLISNISQECIDKLLQFDSLDLLLETNNVTDISLLTPLIPKLNILDIGDNDLDTYFAAGSYVWTMSKLLLNSNNFSMCPQFHQSMRGGLLQLFLNYNKMSCLEEPHLAGFIKLKVLDVSNNELTSFPMASCYHSGTSLSDVVMLPALETLDLGSNLMPDTPDLREMPVLLVLDISNNDLVVLDTVMLTGLWNLSHVKAMSNVITEFPDFSIIGPINNITFVNMSGNAMTKLDSGILKPLTKIEILDVSKNKLVTFWEDLTSNSPDPTLHSLQLLDLSGNSLSTFKPLFLDRMTNLSVLELHSNDFKTFTNMTFRYKIEPDLRLTLRNNPLKCDRDLCWMKDDQMGHLELDVGNRSCGSPLALSVRNWQDITKEMMRCYGKCSDMAIPVDIRRNNNHWGAAITNSRNYHQPTWRTPTSIQNYIHCPCNY